MYVIIGSSDGEQCTIHYRSMKSWAKTRPSHAASCACWKHGDFYKQWTCGSFQSQSKSQLLSQQGHLDDIAPTLFQRISWEENKSNGTIERNGTTENSRGDAELSEFVTRTSEHTGILRPWSQRADMTGYVIRTNESQNVDCWHRITETDHRN